MMPNKFDTMSREDCEAWIETPEFRQLYTELCEITRRGDKFTVEWAAEFVGVPTGVLAWAIGAALARMNPDAVVVVDTSEKVTH
jgi:hypothetical protein